MARGYQVFAKNTLSGGAADIVLNFGRASDTRVVGDFFGSGTDTPGFIRYPQRLLKIYKVNRNRCGAG